MACQGCHISERCGRISKKIMVCKSESKVALMLQASISKDILLWQKILNWILQKFDIRRRRWRRLTPSSPRSMIGAFPPSAIGPGGTPFIRMRILRAASEHNNIHPYIRPEAVPAFDPAVSLSVCRSELNAVCSVYSPTRWDSMPLQWSTSRIIWLSVT